MNLGGAGGLGGGCGLADKVNLSVESILNHRDLPLKPQTKERFLNMYIYVYLWACSPCLLISMT